MIQADWTAKSKQSKILHLLPKRHPKKSNYTIPKWINKGKNVNLPESRTPLDAAFLYA